MKEKILTTRKNGMAVLLLSILIYAAAIAGTIYGSMLLEEGKNPALFSICLTLLCITWLLWPGLKVLKPQEALVLTLFGKYIGTLKEPGFYFVNPFCSAVNPASKTKLSQIGRASCRERVCLSV